MPLPLVVTIPNGNYKVGSSSMAQSVVPPGSSQLTLALDTSQWTNPVQQLTISLEQSQDGGATWAGGGSWTAVGDALPNPVVSAFQWEPTVTHLRGTITITGAAIHTNGTITVS